MAQFADIYHEMACTVYHDGRRVTEVSGQTIRYPANLCPGAVASLATLKGYALDTPLSDFYADGRAKQQCTHLYDLAVLAIQHCRRQGERLYEAEVPDMTGTVDVSVTCNGALIHQWQILNEHIVAPDSLKGRPVIKGFMNWARNVYQSAEEFEAAMVLSKTIFIARGRRFNMAEGQRGTMNQHELLTNSCYAYQAERAHLGRYLGTNERDFTEGVDFYPVKFV